MKKNVYYLFVIIFVIFYQNNFAQYGNVVGTFDNVSAYSNGSVSNVSNEYNYYNSTNTGMKWQCVEYVNRYYLAKFNKNIRVAGHNAIDYFPNAQSHGLTAIPNNGSQAPKVGDIVCSNGGSYGHTAIIREVGSNYVKVIQQNWYNNSNDNSVQLTYSNQNGVHSIGNFSASYPVVGWLTLPSGYIKVKTGVNVPATVTKGTSFQISFSLKETNNLPLNLDEIAVAINKPDGTFMYDAVNYTASSYVNFASGEEKSYSLSSTVFDVATTLPGTYSVVVKGRIGTNWFNVTTLSGATNPKSFSLINATYLLSLTKTGTGNGQIKVNGSLKSLPYSQQYASGTQVTIEAVSDGNSSFSGWGGSISGTNNPTSITMNGNKDISVGFQLQIIYYTLSLTNTGTGSGQIKVNGSLKSLPYSQQYQSGTQVSIEAVPDGNSTFSGWSGSISGTNNPTSFTLNGDKNISVGFQLQIIYYTLSLTNTGTGSGQIKVNGSLKSLPYSQQYQSGTQVSLEAVPDGNSTFTGWSGSLSGTNNPTSITMNSNKDISVGFQFQTIYYTLSLTKTGTGSGQIKVNGSLKSLPYTQQYESGTLINLEAISDGNSIFTGWSGSLSGTNNPTSIIIDGNKNISVGFQLQSIYYTLSLTKTGTGNGQVKVNGTLKSLPYSQQFESGTQVSLEAIPDAGNSFTGWSGNLSGNGNPSSVTMDDNKSIAVGFQLQATYYTLSLTKTGTGNGQVKVNGTLKTLPYSQQYESGTQVSLEAIPDAGNSFTGWSGNLSGNGNPSSVTMDDNKSIAVGFQLQATYYTLSLTKTGTGNGQVKVNGTLKTLPYSQQYESGTQVSLEAIPDAGNSFTGWSGNLSGNINPSSITINGNINVSIIFDYSSIGWIPIANLQFNMSLIAQLYIDNSVSTSSSDIVGAFVGNECRGIASPNETNGLLFLTVGTNVQTGETITFKAWRSSTQEILPIAQTIPFQNMGEIGTLTNPYRFDAGLKNLILNFGTGYTWFSVNVNPGNMNINTLFSSTNLNLSANDRIIGQTNFCVWDGTQWQGSLSTIDPKQSYIMKTTSQEYILTGVPVPNNPISFSTGYTWTGYLPQNLLPINTALANLNPLATSNDRIIGQNAFAVWDGTQWLGSLTNLLPGGGYKFRFTNSCLLTYPTLENVIVENIKEESLPVWVPMPNQQFNMSIICKIKVDDNSLVYAINENDKIGAFVVAGADTQCRGVASPTSNGLIFLTISSNIQNGEKVFFKFYYDQNNIIKNLIDTISFFNMNEIGTLTDPYIFNAAQVPVELTSFTFSMANNSVVLNWTTATEVNNNGFAIERSADRENWEQIEFLAGKGTTTEPQTYAFVDISIINSGTYFYRLKQIDFDGSFEYSPELIVFVDLIPQTYILTQNYPNPFNPSTKINYSLPTASFVSIKIYDALGNEIMTLVNESKDAGYYETTFDASEFASGIYLYKMESGNYVQVKKMIILK